MFKIKNPPEKTQLQGLKKCLKKSLRFRLKRKQDREAELHRLED